MTINPTALADHAGELVHVLVREINPGELEPYRGALTEYLGTQRYQRLLSDQALAPRRVDDFIDHPNQRGRTLPDFFGWLRDTGRYPFGPTGAPSGNPTTPAGRAEIDWVRIRDTFRDSTHGQRNDMLTTEALRTWSDVIDRAVESNADRMITREVMDRILAGSPTTYDVTIPALATWILNHPATLHAMDPALPAPQPPRSPRDAFPTREALERAVRAWGSDTNEHGRLPESMPAIRDSRQADTYYQRSNIRSGTRGFDWVYMDECASNWDSDTWPDAETGEHWRSDYASGFWRDVRTLGYGTEHWDAMTKRQTTTEGATMPDTTATTGTPMPIGPGHPGWNDWWTTLRTHAERDGYMNQFRTLAEAMGYAAPREYLVQVRVTSPRALDRTSALAYIREHPEAITGTRANDVYSV